ncbi:predicted protein [Histoplasma capsulatum var. duboisii H88]|uniref:Predicted protein n=2 Tax=Ajellomyces capsulatus TaxID=5037 RepID=F0UIR1_AJEC8|nr:predicted protein [Histoplasma capsulatum H143]EGC45614.1 predicted protein [Histoplasma capsulatum var. duboisii H88]
MTSFALAQTQTRQNSTLLYVIGFFSIEPFPRGLVFYIYACCSQASQYDEAAGSQPMLLGWRNQITTSTHVKPAGNAIEVAASWELLILGWPERNKGARKALRTFRMHTRSYLLIAIMELPTCLPF